MNMKPSDRWAALLLFLLYTSFVFFCGVATGGMSCAASVF